MSIVRDPSVVRLRDKHVDVMLCWGILFVVLGHSGYQMPYFFFPSYAFHMAFFFFISGYLFKTYDTAREKAGFIVKKINHQLVPYFILNLTFGLVTVFLAQRGIQGGSGLSWRSLFVEPFLGGHQFNLNIPGWFLLNLFLINVIAQVITFRNSRKVKIALFCVILPIAIFAVSLGANYYKDIRLTLVRTAFGLLFFYLGILVQEYKDKVLKLAKMPLLVFAAWSLVILLANIYGNISYPIVWGSMGNKHFMVPLITTLLIIFISYSVCYYISQGIEDGSFILKIGQNSFYIMFLHLFIFFLINACFYAMGKVDLAVLSKRYHAYDPKRFFLLYDLSGVLIPTWIGMFAAWVSGNMGTWVAMGRTFLRRGREHGPEACV